MKMAYKALYREWRPQTFEDMIGQEGIKRTIKNQIVMNRVPHAYLFCGTRGTGKTTTAKILAKAINCPNVKDGEPCNQCETCIEINNGSHMDVIEIDAASNTGVDNIRRLIDDVKYPPHNARYKVYIIDEVHMLSLSAFNALLKTLEEPPSYVKFILATTDPQKVPATILSRCQRFDFKRIGTADIAGRLRAIADENKVDVEDMTLDTIAKISDGAMRDAISIFDQAISVSEGRVEYRDVANMLGLASGDYIFNLVDDMIEKNVDDAMDMIDETIMNGKDVMQFIKDITRHFRNLLMVKISKRPEDVMDISQDSIKLLKEQAKNIRSEEIMRAISIMLKSENDAKFATQPRIIIELAVIKFCKREYDSSPEMLLNRINQLEDAVKNGIAISPEVIKAAPAASPKPEKKRTLDKVEKTRQDKTAATEEDMQGEPIGLDQVKTCWQEVINTIKAEKKVVVGVMLALGEICGINGNIITIGFDKDHAFGKENLEKNENKKIVEDCFSKVLNKRARVEFKITGNESNELDEAIERTKEILGDGIVEVIEE
jgi:DNA polymerase-3 subunit gamma/tau